MEVYNYVKWIQMNPEYVGVALILLKVKTLMKSLDRIRIKLFYNANLFLFNQLTDFYFGITW